MGKCARVFGSGRWRLADAMRREGCQYRVAQFSKGVVGRLWAGQGERCRGIRGRDDEVGGDGVGAVHRLSTSPVRPGASHRAIDVSCHQLCSLGLRSEGPSMVTVMQRWRIRERRALVRCSLPRNRRH